MIDNLSIAVDAFARRILMIFLVDESLLPTDMNFSTSFREPLFSVEMPPLFFFYWNTCTPFYLHSHGGKFHLMLAPNYGAGMRLCQMFTVICTACVSNSWCGVASAFYFFWFVFFCVKSFFLVDLLKFEVHSLGRLWTDMVAM